MSVDNEEDTNVVLLSGRVASDPELRTLPSGDPVVTLRLVVRRRSRRRPRGPMVDTLECTAWTAAARRSVRAWTGGDRVEVEGHLRRRFWRGPAGPASRYEVEVVRGRRVRLG